MSAECRETKHQWCHGQALDLATDELGGCRCECHPAAALVAPVTVTIYVKPSACPQCTMTKNLLDQLAIPYQVRAVHDDDQEMADELRREAETQGVQPTMPCVAVYDPATHDVSIWFGFQPDKIKALVKEHAA